MSEPYGDIVPRLIAHADLAEIAAGSREPTSAILTK